MSKTTYKNCTSIPTWKMKEILDSHHTTGIDGADYGPIADELQSELYKRQQAESERELTEFLINQKLELKHQILVAKQNRRK